MKKALFVGSIVDTFAGELSQELRNDGWIIDAFIGHRNAAIYPRLSNFFNRVYIPFKPVSQRVLFNPLVLFSFLVLFFFGPQQYSVVHFHYASNPLTILFSWMLRGKFRKILTVYGTDFYGSSKLRKFIIRLTVRNYDVVTFANEQTLKDFAREMALDDCALARLKICRFGLRTLDFCAHKLNSRTTIKRNPPYLVAIGYNGNPAQQHLEIIHHLTQLDPNIKAQIKIVVPMTYGVESSKYKEDVKSVLEQVGVEYQILDSFLSCEEIAQLRFDVDILIQLQISDQFSGSMQEHLYLGAVVITGSWLPYQTFKSENIFFKEIDSVSEVSVELAYVVKHFKELSQNLDQNSDTIFKLSSWQYNRNSWKEIFEKS